MDDKLKYSGGLKVETNLNEMSFLDLFKLLGKRIIWFLVKVWGVKILLILPTATAMLWFDKISDFYWFIIIVSLLSVRAFEALVRSGKILPFK